MFTSVNFFLAILLDIFTNHVIEIYNLPWAKIAWASCQLRFISLDIFTNHVIEIYNFRRDKIAWASCQVRFIFDDATMLCDLQYLFILQLKY